jgi:hypothetical protein
MAAGNQYANVEHWLLWNGLGVYYSINDQLTVGVYVRNLLRSDTAKDYIFTRNELVVEPKVTWKLNENIEFYAAFNYTIMIDTMSRELNRVNKTGFIAGKTPVETTDMTQEFKIPLGFTIKI